MRPGIVHIMQLPSMWAIQISHGVNVPVTQDHTKEDCCIVSQALQNPITAVLAIQTQMLEFSSINLSFLLPQSVIVYVFGGAKGYPVNDVQRHTWHLYSWHHGEGSHRV